jgi:hypothetical protein
MHGDGHGDRSRGRRDVVRYGRRRDVAHDVGAGRRRGGQSALAVGRCVDQVDDRRGNAHGLAMGRRVQRACADDADRRCGNEHEGVRAARVTPCAAGRLGFEHANLFEELPDARLRKSHYWTSSKSIR